MMFYFGSTFGVVAHFFRAVTVPEVFANVKSPFVNWQIDFGNDSLK